MKEGRKNNQMDTVCVRGEGEKEGYGDRKQKEVNEGREGRGGWVWRTKINEEEEEKKGRSGELEEERKGVRGGIA